MLWSVEGESMSGSRKYCHGREEDEERLLEYGKRIFPVITYQNSFLALLYYAGR